MTDFVFYSCVVGIIVLSLVAVGGLAEFLHKLAILQSVMEYLVNWNVPYLASRRFISWLVFLLRFLQYMFDLHSDLNSGKRFDVGKPYRIALDRERFLHLVCHCVVYLPVIGVVLVGAVLGADRDDLAFFVAVAASTVSLEICIGIILSKSQGLQDLSRQTHRVVNEFSDDAKKMAGWMEYMQLRTTAAREGVVKAALITCVSLVLFVSIVGIEAYRLSEHSDAHTREKVLHWLSSHANHAELKADDLMRELGHSKEVSPLLWLAGVMSTCMFFIAFVKLWMQTRSCLESHDAIDRFETSEEAVDAFKRDVVFHLLDHAQRREMETNTKQCSPTTSSH